MSHRDPFDIILLLSAVFLILCVFASKLSSRLGVPALILFLGIGMLAGSEGPGGIAFADFALTKQLGMILLGFILFAGGLETDWGHLKPVLWRGLALSSIGVVATTVLVGTYARYLLGLTLMEGLLLGAIVSSTDAAAIFSVLRGRGMVLKDRLGPLVEIESGTNDPVAVFLTASLTEIVLKPQTSLAQLIPSLLQQMPIGLVVGLLFGKASVWLINHLRLEFDGLYSVVTLATVAATYGAAPLVGGNQFIAIYVAGVVMGSSVFVHKTSLKQFHNGIAWLLQIAVFLALGLLVFPSQIMPTIGAGLALAGFMVFFARPISVYLSLAASKMSFKSKTFVAWAGLRGAFPIILGTFPVLAGLEEGHRIFNLVFFVVLVSVLVQGTTLQFVAKKLGVIADRISGEDRQSSRQSETLEVILNENSSAAGKQVIELGLPNTALIVLLKRGDENYVPQGSTVLRANDRLLIASRKDDHQELMMCLGGRAYEVEPVV